MTKHFDPVLPSTEELIYLRRYDIKPLEGKVYINGKEVGHKNSHGYIVISGKLTGIGRNRKKHLRSHLIWWSYYNCWPKQMLDHKNTDQQDDRINNLRYSTPVDNNANRKKKRNLPTGVMKMRGANRFESRIVFKGKTRYLGSYATPEEAGNVYQRVKQTIAGYTLDAIEAMGLTEEEFLEKAQKGEIS